MSSVKSHATTGNVVKSLALKHNAAYLIIAQYSHGSNLKTAFSLTLKGEGQYFEHVLIPKSLQWIIYTYLKFTKEKAAACPLHN